MLRAIKDADELARLACAAGAADATFNDILGLPFAGQRERDIGNELAELLPNRDTARSTSPSSAPVRTEQTHHEVSDRIIRDGDMVVLDFGALKDGYRIGNRSQCTSARHPGGQSNRRTPAGDSAHRQHRQRTHDRQTQRLVSATPPRRDRYPWPPSHR